MKKAPPKIAKMLAKPAVSSILLFFILSGFDEQKYF
jgi:hypothetical protein